MRLGARRSGAPAVLPDAGRSLLLVGCYPPPWGGIAVHLHGLRRLAADEGIDVEVLDIGEGHGLRDGVDRVRDGGSYRAFAAGLVRAALRGAAVHVHIPGNNLKAWAVAFAASLPWSGRHRRLLTVHSGLAPSLLERSELARRAARGCARGFAKILCTNAGIAQALQGIGIPRSKLQAFNPFLGVAERAAPPPARALEASRRFRILLSCALAPGPQYGEEVLLEALQLLRARDPELGCLVFGPETLGAAFAERIAARGLGGAVIPLGELGHDASLATMRLGRIFLRPSLADGDSISVREALALGVEVVASDAAPRPPEVTTFRSGDARAMAAQIEEVLGRRGRGARADRDRIPQASGSGAAAILDAWRHIGAASPLQGVRA